MDSIALYQGWNLENYFYTQMNDLFDVDDLKTQLIKKYPAYLAKSHQCFGEYAEFMVYYKNTAIIELRLLIGSA